MEPLGYSQEFQRCSMSLEVRIKWNLEFQMCTKRTIVQNEKIIAVPMDADFCSPDNNY